MSKGKKRSLKSRRSDAPVRTSKIRRKSKATIQDKTASPISESQHVSENSTAEYDLEFEVDSGKLVFVETSQAEPCRSKICFQEETFKVVTAEAISNLQLDYYDIYERYFRKFSLDSKNKGRLCEDETKRYKNFAFFSKYNGQEFNRAAIRQRISTFTSIEIEKIRDVLLQDNFVLLRIKDTFPEANNRLEEVEKIIPLSIKFRHPLLLFHSEQAATIDERISFNSKSLKHLEDIIENRNDIEEFDLYIHELHHSEVPQRYTGKHPVAAEEYKDLPLCVFSSPWDKCLINFFSCEAPWRISQWYLSLCEDTNCLQLRETSHIAAIRDITEAEIKILERKKNLLSEIENFIILAQEDINTSSLDKNGKQHELGQKSTLLSRLPFSNAFDVPNTQLEIIEFLNKLSQCIGSDVDEQNPDIHGIGITDTSFCIEEEHNDENDKDKQPNSSENYPSPEVTSNIDRVFRKVANEMMDDFDPSHLWLPSKLSDIKLRLSKISPMEIKDGHFSRAKLLLMNAGTIFSQLDLLTRERNMLLRTILSDEAALLRQVQRYFPEAEEEVSAVRNVLALNYFESEILSAIRNLTQNPLFELSNTVTGRIRANMELVEDIKNRLKAIQVELPSVATFQDGSRCQTNINLIMDPSNCKQMQDVSRQKGYNILHTLDEKSVEDVPWLLDELCYRVSMYNALMSETEISNSRECASLYHSLAKRFQERTEKIIPRLKLNLSNLLTLRKMLVRYGEDSEQTLDDAIKFMSSHTTASDIWIVDSINLEFLCSSTLEIPVTIPDRITFCSKLLACIIGDISPNDSLEEHVRLFDLPVTGSATFKKAFSLKNKVLAYLEEQSETSKNTKETGLYHEMLPLYYMIRCFTSRIRRELHLPNRPSDTTDPCPWLKGLPLMCISDPDTAYTWGRLSTGVTVRPLDMMLRYWEINDSRYIAKAAGLLEDCL